MQKITRIISIFALGVLAACGSKSTTQASLSDDNAASDPVAIMGKAFNADSAYAFVAAQTAFGPRVPNSEAHRRCGDWLVEKLTEYGASNIQEQKVDLKAYDGTMLAARNITASYNPDARKRVLLISHWDTRPWADQESDPALRNTPIDGANDGASGVGVILEVARCISQKSPRIGVDILFADAEDYGARSDDTDVTDSNATFCLGSAYWVSDPTVALQQIRYAVLLDMVGGKDAVFPKEYFSNTVHPEVVERVWSAAKQAGHSGRFVDRPGSPIYDDHIPLLQAGVPAIDIIEIDHPLTHSFNPTWHTHADNIDNIDRQTLKAVGETLLQLIYTE